MIPTSYYLGLSAILFAIGGRFLLTLPLTLASLALLKLKGFDRVRAFCTSNEGSN